MKYVPRFAGLWLFVCIVTVVVFALTAYLGLAHSLGDAGRARLLIVLSIQTICVIIGMVALAVFTTHRLAGPLVGLLRAFEGVKAGDLEHPLRFRQTDSHLIDLEKAFNEMLASLRSRMETGRAGEPLAGRESA